MVLTTQDWLNRAKFVASFDSGDYAYFFFQEIQYTALIAGDDKNVRIKMQLVNEKGKLFCFKYPDAPHRTVLVQVPTGPDMKLF